MLLSHQLSVNSSVIVQIYSMCDSQLEQYGTFPVYLQHQHHRFLLENWLSPKILGCLQAWIDFPYTSRMSGKWFQHHCPIWPVHEGMSKQS